MDILDSRDLKEKMDELNLDIETLREQIGDQLKDHPNVEPTSLLQELATLQEELNELEEMESECSEFSRGCQFINENDFTEYTKSLLFEIGDLPDNLPWYIANNIDWDGVAEDLKVDYNEVVYQGETYLFRD